MINYYQNLVRDFVGEIKSEKANSEQSEGVPRVGDTLARGEELAGKTTGLIY